MSYIPYVGEKTEDCAAKPDSELSYPKDSKCLHGGFKVHLGQRPLLARDPFILAAFCLISVILYYSTLYKLFIEGTANVCPTLLLTISGNPCPLD